MPKLNYIDYVQGGMRGNMISQNLIDKSDTISW